MKPLLYLFISLLLTSQTYADIVLYDHARDSSPLVPLINSARKTLDIEIYEMNNPAVQDALLKAAREGVHVRILIEPSPVGFPCDLFIPAEAPEALFGAECNALKVFKNNLEQLGGEVIPFRKALCGSGSAGNPSDTAGCVQHGKIAIADRSDAVLSTGNFNSIDLCDLAAGPSSCQQDFTLSIRNPTIVNDIQTVFDLDWIGVPYDLPHALPPGAFNTLSISPFSLSPLVGFIHSARKSIEIAEQYLNDPTMNAALIEAAKHGVDVKILVASYCAFAKPGAFEVNRATGNNTAFESAGAKVRVYPSAILIKGKPGYLHAKAIIVDGQVAWIGSVNGSTQSLTRNREYGFFFSDPVAVRKLRAAFMRDFMNPNTESWQESLKCTKDIYRL